MDVPEETLIKSTPKNSGIKNFRSSSLINNRFISEYEDTINMVEEHKSLGTMKKIYSVDRIAYDGSSANIEAENRSNEKISKSGKLFRTSSTTLERENDRKEFKLSRGTSDTRHKNAVSGNDLFLLDVLDMKKYALSNYIQKNPKAADIKWSLFCAACHSYRFDSILRPFPPMFLEEDVKNIDKLRDVAESCPSINVLYKQLQERNSILVFPELINLLYWVLIHVREPQLKFIPQAMHKAVMSKVMCSTEPAAPNYIFQVLYSKQAKFESYNDMGKKYKTIYGFHGSRLDNFYSILNFGLRTSFNKTNLRYPGIYLSTELNVSLPYSKTGFSWGGSHFGSQISIVALCEMADHPDVKYLDEIGRRKKNLFRRTKDWPDKYFIVRNNELIRVKYLLIYRDSLAPISPHQLSTVIAWFQRNKVMAVVLAYMVLLVAVSISSNSTTYKFYKRIVRKIGRKVLNY